MARGGRPDPDAPNDPESTRYRVSVEMEEKELWQQENEMSMQTNLDPRSAVRVMSMADPAVSTVHAPDPMALVRDQLQNLQQEAVAPPTHSQQSSSARAGRWLSEKFSCTCPCTACMQEAKRKPSQRVHQEALRALVSRMRPWPGKPLMRSSVWHVASSAPSDLQSSTSTSDGNITHTHILMPAGLECKKELGQIQSMKLEVQGKLVLKEAEVSMDKHIQKLTKWYTRIMMCMHVVHSFSHSDFFAIVQD